MRRIYESSALHRDDDEPHAPHERETDAKPQAARSIHSAAWSRRLVPTRLRHYAVSVGIETPKTDFPPGEPVPFRVTMENAMPFPVTIETQSPLLWNWYVDGVEEAAHIPLQNPPDDPSGFTFDRGERKQFTRRWQQTFQVTDSEWEPAEPGEYTISAALNVPDANAKGLSAETTVRLLDG
jgi:hypothetical protein